MRLTYVAQHAFHHLEKHLDKTAVQYIMWRFAGADDLRRPSRIKEICGCLPITEDSSRRT